MERETFEGINPRDYKLDLVHNTLTVSKRFNDKLQRVDTSEFAFYTYLMSSIPNLRIINKTHSTPSTYRSKQRGEKFSHNPNKGLTFKAMESFIKSLSNSKEYENQYNKVKAYAEAQGRRAHSIVVKWFIEQFPEYRKNPLYYFRNSPKIIPFAPEETVQELPKAANQ